MKGSAYLKQTFRGKTLSCKSVFNSLGLWVKFIFGLRRWQVLSPLADCGQVLPNELKNVQIWEILCFYLRASFVSTRRRSRRLAQQVWSWRTSWSSTVSGRRLAERSKGEQLSALRTADRSQHLLPLSFSHSFALCVSASPKAKKQLKRKLDRGVKKLRGLEKWIVELKKKIFFK